MDFHKFFNWIGFFWAERASRGQCYSQQTE